MIFRKIYVMYIYDCKVFELCFFVKIVEIMLVMDNNLLFRLVLGLKYCSLF